ncbi:MAG: diguanylate cyclase [Pyrinomonadaceae bacterium]
MSLDFHIVYLAVSIVISSGICLYAWNNPQTRGAKAFALSGFASIVWMFGDFVARISPNYAGQWIGELIRYVGVETLPVALLVFVYQFCGKKISRKTIGLLSIVPLISWLFLLTNPLHNLFFSSAQLNYPGTMKVVYGLYFWYVHIPYCYTLLLTSFLTVLLEISRASRHYRPPIILLFVSLCIPFVFNVLGVFKLVGPVSFTPMSFPIFFVVMAIGIFRYRLLGSNPIAFETVFHTIRDGVVILDCNNIIKDINAAATLGTGRKAEQMVGLNFREAFSNWPDLVEKYEDEPDLYDEVELEVAGTMRFISVRIVPLNNSNGGLNGKIITFRDITDRKRYEFSLETLAFHDPLTRLANRLKFQHELETTLEKSMESRETFAVLFFDLNQFKAVNDTMGHEIGDELLKYVAARVVSILRHPDILARFGGDEFAILLHRADREKVRIVAERILESVQKPFRIEDRILTASLSIGAAFYPEHGESTTQLLRHADQAMYQAKSAGGGVAFFHPKENTKIFKVA